MQESCSTWLKKNFFMMFPKFQMRERQHHSPTAILTSLPEDVPAYIFCLSSSRAHTSADDLRMPDNCPEYLIIQLQVNSWHELTPKFDLNQLLDVTWILCLEMLWCKVRYSETRLITVEYKKKSVTTSVRTKVRRWNYQVCETICNSII